MSNEVTNEEIKDYEINWTTNLCHDVLNAINATDIITTESIIKVVDSMFSIVPMFAKYDKGDVIAKLKETWEVN